MKKQNQIISNLFLLFFVCLSQMISAQVLPSSQSNGMSGGCVTCSITNSGFSIDNDVTSYAELDLGSSGSPEYIYQNFQFSTDGSSGDLIEMIIEDPMQQDLDESLLSSVTISTSFKGNPNNDSQNSSQYAITKIGLTSQFLLKANISNSFDEVNFTLSGGTASGLSALRIYSVTHTSVALGINLIDFSAILNSNHSIDLHWSSQSETNNKFYTVEKSSDGVNFESLIDIPGNINSSETRQYDASDANPFSGYNYYRLLQTDMNGQVNYFKTLVIYNPSYLKTSIYPNPVSNTLNIQLENSESAFIKVINYSGDIYICQNIPADTFHASFNIIDLKAGIYLVQIQQGKYNYQYKILKQ